MHSHIRRTASKILGWYSYKSVIDVAVINNNLNFQNSLIATN